MGFSHGKFVSQTYDSVKLVDRGKILNGRRGGIRSPDPVDDFPSPQPFPDGPKIREKGPLYWDGIWRVTGLVLRFESQMAERQRNPDSGQLRAAKGAIANVPMRATAAKNK